MEGGDVHLSSADDWKNSTILGAYDPQAIRKLKDEVGSIHISGSYPIVLGSGSKLCPDGAQCTPLALAGQKAFDNGVLHLTHPPVAS